jgi:hypothetical protein
MLWTFGKSFDGALQILQEILHFALLESGVFGVG